jgi:NAD(P)-dependent dehydrogenase (short-subunit alcohol dehydrogenase family)
MNGYTTCSATKAALRSYARTWTQEFKDRGIPINTRMLASLAARR